MSAHDETFTAFVAARRPHLVRVAYALCGDWHRADDLVQTALVKLYASWRRVTPGSEEAYVRTILVRAHIDQTRRPWWKRERSGDLPERAGPAAQTEQVEDRSELFEALQALPEMQRKVVVLRHWLQLSVAETARELRIGEGTVKSHSSRGLAALRTRMESGDASRA
ncbi:RNA polymerase sigma-70 factor (sigma-E family) [Nocardioides luteus]|uniref:RNA polymerase sigma24 factor n=1 Tax=Nocardioides luteus TaxID=1844 RepID=A0ABQ5SXG6_9ACTN|nr:SigE family RNA polymerase sigma factor [Nocardioides luteus]MDR7312431.1 RNA polymerase sigma-70 factor (sigma-E family) [Nocardioides luteus]GGR58442.1 RNA polymerase sigma24 factor [Nocardioides luteus]GLJ68679.1 RNA polymerase sigma24 factor [Nocardioides luteus]